MPEGPQARRAGNLIARHAGSAITKIVHPPSRPPWALQLPVTITAIRVKGKNIFIYLSNGSVIYNHMLMWGSWRQGCTPYGKKRLNTCFCTTHGKLGYFGGGILKLLTRNEAEAMWNRLGPELVSSSDAQEAFMLVKEAAVPIGEAVLSQELIAGIGNIYKSEGLFAARIHPLRPATTVTSAEFQRLFSFLQPQMFQDEKRSGPITTTPPAVQKTGKRTFVYRRYHQPCLLCGAKIERLYQGKALKRSTYYCPSCQKLPPP